MQTERSIPDSLRNFDLLPDSARVNIAVVTALMCRNRQTIWRWVKDGQFPAPEKNSPRGQNLWRVGVLRECLK